MTTNRLRIFNGSPEPASNEAGSDQQDTPRETPATLTVSVGEIFPALADAMASGRTWLEDFKDEEITIPYDLYEVILAYQHYQRLTA